ncbi:integrator complex subunit 13-like [Odontomachus brunneus]|uniref:integrator complex subunit 13-like n=1 Tax=Odontomachus brunneus TaxID=486640 RepID=UPI0013F2581E|nr:integrator complex subunit 13-like [Odontomachus brunneus]XP_032665484.1 integrator complex subunit 13-like [Odontomachus brunneus]
MPVSRKCPFTENMDDPIKKMRSRLKNKYWPITSNSIMLNIKLYINPLPDFMVKEELTAGEVLQCKQVLSNLRQLEEKYVPLPSSSTSHSGNSMKKKERYHQLWEEIETFLRHHAKKSDAHMEVFKYLLDIRSTNNKYRVELDQALRELDCFGQDGVGGRVNLIRATMDSPISSTTDSLVSPTTDSQVSPTMDSQVSSTTDSPVSPTTDSPVSPTQPS